MSRQCTEMFLNVARCTRMYRDVTGWYFYSRNELQLIDLIEDDLETSTLFLVLDNITFITLFNLKNSSLFTRNSWIFVLDYVGNQPKEYLEETIQSFSFITLHSLIYFVIPTRNQIAYLYEAYRFPEYPQGKLIINELGFFENEELKLTLGEIYIWERRRNLEGSLLRISTVESSPFLIQKGKVRKTISL